MFTKNGDSQLTKVMSIKDGKKEDIKIAKCSSCQLPTEECDCNSKIKEEEEKDERAIEE